MDYPIPKSSADAWQKHKGKAGQNPGLILDRFAPDWRLQPTLKKDGLEAARAAASKADAPLLQAWNTRWAAIVRAMRSEPFSLKTDWRFVAGLGRKGPLEAGFTFNRYGFPLLPGSSVKGIARACAVLMMGISETDADFVAIFGRAAQKAEDESVASSGGAVFIEAIPASLPVLELDIMNPHFPKYYSGEQPPADNQNPVPVYFLTVAPRTEFRFAVGWREALDDESRRLRDLAKEWLLKGLTEMGAGAKTSAGYGYFESVFKPEPAKPSAKVETLPVPQKPTPEAPVLVRRGTIIEIRPDKHYGRVRDAETGKDYRFSTSVIQGNTPGRKVNVMFELQDEQVIKVRKV